MSDKAVYIGVDIGGTFTDIVVSDLESTRVFKVPTTQDDPSLAVTQTIMPLFENNSSFLFELRHGTTVATNAIIQNTGARTAFVATSGFTDILDLGRQARRDLYSLKQARTAPIPENNLRFAVKERTDADGEIVRPLGETTVKNLVRQLIENDIESVAVCLLFSHLQPRHEILIGEALDNTGMHVSLSHAVHPAAGEYERACACFFNARVSPLLKHYLDKMQSILKPLTFWIMSSRGTVISSARAGTMGIETALSGPAAGVAGVAEYASRHDLQDIITFDMGGTSTDVSLIENGRVSITRGASIAGRPLGIESIDITTIGAGGGSIAYMDSGGMLRVGPQSAGANPGPACYGQGGPPTVTDANLILGRIQPDFLLAEQIRPDRQLSIRAFQPLCRDLGMSLEEAALGVIRIANSNMERALRRISLEQGYDPRRFTLASFGGAGPLHACDLAGALAVPDIFIPPDPGALCAFGALCAPDVIIRKKALSATAGPGAEKIPKELVDRAFTEIESKPLSKRIKRFIELRYKGQSRGIQLPWNENDLSTTGKAFRDMHERKFGRSHGMAETELLSISVHIIGNRPGLSGRGGNCPSGNDNCHPLCLSRVYVDSGYFEIPVYDRLQLAPGNELQGPLLLVEPTSTVFMDRNFSLKVLYDSGIILSRCRAVIF